MDGQSHEPAPQQPDKKPDNFWQLVAQATTLGWNLVVPIVGGVMLGRYLDDRFGHDFTWTMSLLALGVLVAFNNLYSLVVEHGRVKRGNQEQGKTEEDEGHAEDH